MSLEKIILVKADNNKFTTLQELPHGIPDGLYYMVLKDTFDRLIDIDGDNSYCIDIEMGDDLEKLFPQFLKIKGIKYNLQLNLRLYSKHVVYAVFKTPDEEMKNIPIPLEIKDNEM